MPLPSMPTGTVSDPTDRGPQGATAPRSQPALHHQHRIEELEAQVATLEAERDRLLRERRALLTQYERVVRAAEHQPRDDEPPAGDGLVLRLRRLLRLR